jgi:P4 family phage/plasmid primase-like protien
MAESPFDLIVTRLQDEGLVKKSRKRSEVQSRCPAHMGKSEDLTVWRGANDDAIIKCWAGCSTHDILRAIGLEKKDIFADNSATRHGRPIRRTTKDDEYTTKVPVYTDDSKAERVEIDVTFKRICAYDYHDEDWKVLYMRNRWQPSDPRARKRFVPTRKGPTERTIQGLKAGWYVYKYRKWVPVDGAFDRENPPSGDAQWFDECRRVLFGLPLLIQAQRDREERVYLCEGEPDAISLRRIGLTTTTADSGATDWKDEYSQILAGFKEVVIVADQDRAGITGAQLKAENLAPFGVKLSCVFPATGKDAEDHVSAGLNEHDFIPFDPVEEMAWITPECHEDSETPEPEHQAEEPVGTSTEPPAPPTRIKTTLHKWPKGKQLPLNDLEATEFFNSYAGKSLRYCEAYQQFLLWDGTRYQRDDRDAAFMARFKPFANKLVEKAWETMEPFEEFGGFEADPKRHWMPGQKKIWARGVAAIKYAKKLQNKGGFQAIKDLCPQMEPMPVSPLDLDSYAHLLPCLNGTVDLMTGELLQSEPDHLFTKRSNVVYDARAVPTVWLDFLEFTFDGDWDMIEYLQEVFGYSLTGLAIEHALWFFYGVPRSGKTTIMKVGSDLVGDFYKDLPKQFVMQNRGSENIAEHFARLQGARLVTIVEVMGRDRFDEGLLKKLTGAEQLTARAPFEKSIQFDFIGKLWISGNERPQITEQGEAIWTRFRPIVFHNSVPPEMQDKSLPDKLKAEYAGILNWAVQGAIQWYQRGSLLMPKKVTEEVDQYRMDVNILQRFLRECTKKQPKHQVNKSDYKIGAKVLYENFERWGKAAKVYTMPSKAFYQQLATEPGEVYKKTNEGMHLFERQLIDSDFWRFGITPEEADAVDFGEDFKPEEGQQS